MITRICNRLIKEENLGNLDLFINSSADFEEIPVFSRYNSVSFINTFILKEDTQAFLINLAFYLLNNIKMYAKSKLTAEELNNYFCCLTFVDFDDYDEQGYITPNFFVTRNRNKFAFLSQKQYVDLPSLFLKEAFKKCHLLEMFKFICTSSQENSKRIYAILE